MVDGADMVTSTKINPQAVLFDWDNTLVNTWPVIHRALHDTFVEYEKQPWSLEQVQQRVSRSMRDSFPELFGDDWQRAGEIYQANYREFSNAMLQPLAGAEAVLQKLLANGVFVAVVSNKLGNTLRREVEYLGWGKYFSAVVGSLDAARDKPHADPAEMALADYKGERIKEKIWLVGDSVVDLQCAHACEIMPILYGDDYVGEVAYARKFSSHAELLLVV